MRKNIMTFIALFAVMAASAQETYENARLATEDLNGTARYIGMGGALDALGADISTIGTNPAGIGLFRHSTAQLSFGFVSQQGATEFAGADKTNMSFDQGGFVYSHRTGKKSFLNIAFNYHKSTNFNNILSASSRLSAASQNKLSYLKGVNRLFEVESDNGNIVGNNNLFNTIDYLYYNNFTTSYDEDGYPVYNYNDATGYVFNRANSGYIGEYDFNVSGNIDDRLYLGITIGVHDVNYNGYSEYSENLVMAEGTDIGSVTVTDNRVISGTGVNVKFGMILRPIENSPFRIGVSVATPTWYDLTTRNYTTLTNATQLVSRPVTNYIEDAYDFKLNTPWKFGVSLGTTMGRSFAIGASYDFANYGKIDTRINDGGGYDWWTDDYYETSSSDRAMNRHTDYTLKGVSTFKIGAEYKPIENLAVRVGYNYVSPMYNNNGYKDFFIDSPGTYYTSSTDYTNWKATNRFTCGVGYAVKKLNFDLAYQYTVTKGDFYPFSSYQMADPQSVDNNIVHPNSVDNKRHQLLFTMGYTF